MVVLRDLLIADSQAMVTSLNDSSITLHLSSKIPTPYTPEDALWWINHGSKEQAITKAITYQGKFCGVIGVYLQSFDYKHSAELGYWIAKDYWQKGIASNAVNLFTQWLFSKTSINRIYNPVNADNVASIRVMEKSGFALEGVLKQSAYKYDQYSDEHLYALIKK